VEQEGQHSVRKEIEQRKNPGCDVRTPPRREQKVGAPNGQLDDESSEVQNGGSGAIAEFHCKPGDSDVQIIGDGQQVDEDPHQRDDETNDDDEEEPRCARTVRWRCTGHANNGK